MAIRVLHIFAPNYKQRFGGPIFDWKYAFLKWNNPHVQHSVLDYEQGSPMPALEAFYFEISSSQHITTRSERIKWVFSLIKNLKRHKEDYDVLHFHILWWGGLLAAAWAKLNRIPTVYQSVLLGSDTPSPILKQSLGKIKERLLRNFSVILPISEPLSGDFYDHGYSKDQVITLMNSVDTDLFHPVSSQQEQQILRQKFGLPTEATILIFIGSLIYRKGVDLLVKGFLDAIAKHPDLFLLLVGPQNKGENPSLDEKYVENIHRMIAEKNATKRVQFTGLIKDRKTLADLYRGANFFVFPSRREGLPNVVLEAMASGIPVIVSDLPVLKNVINDRENGILVLMDDALAISHAICDLIENPRLILYLGKSARQYVLSHHDFARWQADLVGIYQKITTKRNISR